MATKSRKSSTNLKKRTSRSSAINIKKDRSSISARTTSIEETFEMQFKKFCVLFNSWIVPEVIVVPYEPPPGDFPQLPSETSAEEVRIDIKNEEEQEKTFKDRAFSFPKVLAIFDNYDIQTVLNTVLCKHFRVDRSMLIAMRKSFQKFDTVGTLKLQFCELENTHLRTLKTVLQKNELITELNIDGNPNRFQNFYVLLKNTMLLHISMRFCQINDRGVHLIALQLSTPFDQSLLSINLSSNFVSDEGATSVANALRINRKLLSLNLSDNWLTDNGCIALTNILRVFSLKHEEIVIRRHRIMDFLLKKAEMIQLQKIKILQGSDTQSLQSYNKKLSKDSCNKLGKDTSTRKSSKGHSSVGSMFKKDPKKSTDIDLQLLEEMVESEMRPDDHPFVKDSYPENKEIYCKGNLKLMHLNLAYNKITVAGLQEITEMLQYQRTAIIQVQEGLSHIILEGNAISDCCSELIDIDDLIREAYSRRFSSASNESRRNSKRKRSGLSRVSITV